MYPRLFELGPFTVYSYGLMLGLAFVIASSILTKELRRKKIDPNLGATITLIALLGGVSGAKILYLFENFSDFAASPLSMAFSPGGLTWYGGFILATALIFYYGRSKGIGFLRIADAASPGLMFGYGFARIGCHLSGDGDYGFPTNLPWAAEYSKGIYPPSQAFKNFPEITSLYGGSVPDTALCHPTPIYEAIICTILFIILWKYRSKIIGDGRMFMWYLIAAGSERFAVEFVRINQRFIAGMSEAQLISIGLIIAGIIGLQKLPSVPMEKK